jgi:uncharacterized protein (UPF0335 family)/ribosome modulation factor
MQDASADAHELREFEDEVPPYRAAEEEAAAIQRDAERELERRAASQAADENLGFDGKPLVVGDIAHVGFRTGPRSMDKSGTLLSIGGGIARVRLNGSKDAIGDAFPFSRVRTEPINGGKPLKTKAEKKAAAQHANHVAEYREALNGGEARPQARPSDGFAHAQEAADEMVPMPKRILPGHNLGVSESTVYRHLGAVRARMQEVQEANSRLRDSWKRAADDGVDKKALRAIMSELKMSPDELIEANNTLNSYRASVHLPHAPPIDPFNSENRDDPAARIAHSRELGIQAGFRGADASTNPYPEVGDPCRESWDDGWRDAQGRMLLRGISEL